MNAILRGHCGSRLPKWRADLYAAAVQKLAVTGGDRTDATCKGGRSRRGKPGSNGRAAATTKLAAVPDAEGESPANSTLAPGDFRAGGQWCDVSHINSKEKTWHKWRQPLAEVETLVRCFSDPGALVIDPCGGGFTTTVA